MATAAIDAEVIRFIRKVKEICVAPNGREYSVIGLKAVRFIAQESQTSTKEVESGVLEQGAIPWRYLRNMDTIGRGGQTKLLGSADLPRNA